MLESAAALVISLSTEFIAFQLHFRSWHDSCKVSREFYSCGSRSSSITAKQSRWRSSTILFFFVGMRTDSWSSDADICHLNENWNASNTRGTPRIKFNRGIVKKHIAGSKCSKESFCLSHSNVCGLWRWNNKMGKSILFVCDQRLFLK